MVMWVESPGNALLGFADQVGIDDEMGAVINWMSRHQTNTLKKFLLIPGVDEMLAALKGRYPMAVVSARHEKSTMRFLEFDLVNISTPSSRGLQRIRNLSRSHLSVPGNGRQSR
jgi:phosphoglycolate phosphatase-like HAD superfamily hydrolase